MALLLIRALHNSERPGRGLPVPLEINSGPDALALSGLRFERSRAGARIVVQGVPGATVVADAVAAVSCSTAASLHLAVQESAPMNVVVALTLRHNEDLIGRVDLAARGSVLDVPMRSQWPVMIGVSVALPLEASHWEVGIALRPSNA
ncbi:MAG: hypothetical protein WDA16_14970 [Candidatus Thermoplasmatota archaeon]